MEERLGFKDKKESDKVINALLYLKGSEGIDFSFLREVLSLESNSKAEQIMLDYVKRFNASDSGLIVKHRARNFYYEVDEEILEKLKRVWNQRKRLRLSSQKLEVLSLVAYKQPISLSLISKMRGKESSYVVNWLVKNGFLVKKRANSRFFHYLTSDLFLNFFRIRSLEELPEVTELKEIERLVLELKDDGDKDESSGIKAEVLSPE